MHFYPIVNLEDGLLKMHTYGTSIRPVDSMMVTELVGQVKKELVQALFRKTGHMPAICGFKSLPSPLKTMFAVGHIESQSKCDQIVLSDWEQIKFVKQFNFNYFPDAIELLDEKGITPPFQNVNQIYAQDASTAAGLSAPATRSNTRLVLEALERPTIDLKKYFEVVEEKGIIPSEWSLITLKAKELENKSDPRDFSILLK